MNDLIRSGGPLLIVALVFVVLIAWLIHSVRIDVRQNRARRRAVERAVRPHSAENIRSATTRALGWNVVVIAVGLTVALVSLSIGLTASADDNPFRQTVNALWVIQGLLGLLITAVGILGATIASMIGGTGRAATPSGP